MVPDSENIQRRPLPGHRHRPKKDKVLEAFTPISMAGRRAPGETKAMRAMANNAKKAEERIGVDFFKFIKKLNKRSVARPAFPGCEPTEFKASPAPMVILNDQDASDSERLPSQLMDMYEPMDTTLDDTQGPIFRFVPQEPDIFDPPGLTQRFPLQQAQFGLGVMLPPPMHQTVQPLEHHHFVDQDQRLRPPVRAYPIDQQFHRGDLVMNQIYPVRPHPQANNRPVMEGYFLVAPHIDIGHAIHQYPDVPIPLQPIIHDELIAGQFMFYPPAYEELVNQPHIPPLVTEIVGHDDRIAYQDMPGEAGELVHPGNHRFFMNADAGELGHDARLFDELFRNGNEGDDDDRR